MRRFLRPYYLLNVLLLASYAATRRLFLDGATQYGRIGGPEALAYWEWRALGVLALALGIHGLKVCAALTRNPNCRPQSIKPAIHGSQRSPDFDQPCRP